MGFEIRQENLVITLLSSGARKECFYVETLGLLIRQITVCYGKLPIIVKDEKTFLSLIPVISAFLLKEGMMIPTCR